MSKRGGGTVLRGKTVYVLGAGFSIPAGAPSQAGIMGRIFHLRRQGKAFDSARQRLREFLELDLALAEEQFPHVPLEDIYTPIDRCIANNCSFRSHTVGDLVRIRQALGLVISRAIAESIPRKKAPADYIHRFAGLLVSQAARRAEIARQATSTRRGKSYDPFAVISLNWDILLDNALHEALLSQHPGTGDYDPFGVVDYCCYISSLDEHDSRVRAGLFSLGCRGFNVKLLKLHGSMNWLQCPNCQRLYVGFGRKLRILDQIGRTQCRHCAKGGLDNRLQGSLVMPTFLKDLSNFQIKLVWQNAGLELMEATKLVFIGYSLPYADFEFRQLLSRMVRPGASIEVVLFRGANPSQFESEKQRYEQFFGKRKLNFHDAGVTGYMDKLIPRAGT